MAVVNSTSRPVKSLRIGQVAAAPGALVAALEIGVGVPVIPEDQMERSLPRTTRATTGPPWPWSDWLPRSLTWVTVEPYLGRY